MAISQTDTVPKLMYEDHGTTCLITSPKADSYLNRSQVLGKERYDKWCGGQNGFDDYAEHLL